MKNQNDVTLHVETPVEIFEYLLFISPSEKIKGEVMMMKEEFHQHYNHIQAIKSKPHVTLINFGASVATEEILILRINEVAKSCQPFDVVLNGVNHFKPHTVFVDIANPEFIVQLVKSLHDALHLPPKYSFFSRRPHMTIAKGLDTIKFQKAILELADKKYTDSFLTDRIILMKRRNSFMRYELVKEFKLGQE